MTQAQVQIGFSAPHTQAATIGLEVLQAGGSAVDAMIAAAAAIAVVYPHMNSLAGDGFWLIHQPGCAPRAIDACGTAAGLASLDWYQQRGFDQTNPIPARGSLAAITLGGTLSGWQKARAIAAETRAGLPLSDLLAPAIKLAQQGIQVTHSLAAASRKVEQQLAGDAEYRRVFMPNGRCLEEGEKLYNPNLAQFMTRLANAGLEDFYRNAQAPGMKPFHTLNPALAVLNDGRRISYGTMGGEGQPQTQAALLTRYLYDNLPLNQAISRGRWLLGRTWGDNTHDLKMEQDLVDMIGSSLRARGHSIKPLPSCNELMGHVGAVVSHPDYTVTAVSDPRSDGAGLVADIERNIALNIEPNSNFNPHLNPEPNPELDNGASHE